MAQTMAAFSIDFGAQGLSVAYLLVGLLYFKCNFSPFFLPIFILRLYHEGDQRQKQKSVQHPMEWIVWKGLARSAEQDQRAVCSLFCAV